MKIVFASDSFKGSLSSYETAELLTKAAKEVFEEVECVAVPIADGGEGTVDALIASRSCAGNEDPAHMLQSDTGILGGSAARGIAKRISASVHGPLMEKLDACYGQLNCKQAVIEMAAASGLTLVPEEKRNPLYTTTYGTGELILDALDKGFEEIYVAIGGSATNDGGMGCARALGVRFLDSEGKELPGAGKDLEKVALIDTSGLDPRICKTKISVVCDVKNPLCGEKGATRIFSAQKGATYEIAERLEAGMCNYRDVIRKQFDTDPDALAGGGAAGGLGTALQVFLGGVMRSGIETVLDLVEFDRLLEGADLVVTGEGRTDMQSVYGKVLCGVGERAKKAGVSAVALCGSLGPGYESIYEHGIISLMTTVDSPMTLEEAMGRAGELYEKAAVRMFRMIKAGAVLRRS